MFIQYNPNPDGKLVGDCVIRAITKVLDSDWDTVYMDICLQGFSMKDMPSSNAVWGAYLYSQPQTNQSNVIWVQGEQAAKAYPVSAGNSMILMDSENDCFYIKSSDNAGMPNRLRKFEYKEVIEGQTQPETPVEQPQYITKEEFEQAMSELRQQRQHYNNNRKGDRNE